MLNRIKKFNRIQKASLIALVVMLFCQLGGLTWAWLTDHDEVTNVFGFHDYYVDIVLTEPNWTSVGRTQAQLMQPGMDIYKDPRVTNITEDSCYIRMQIIVADKDGNVLDDLIAKETNSDKKTALTEKRDAVLAAIAYYDEDSNKFTSINSDFKYLDGYYYYTKGGDNCVALASGESTSPLFTDVKIPTLKSEYADFEDGFIISIKAEAVFATDVDDTSVKLVAERFASFNNETDDDEDTDTSDNGDTDTDTDTDTETDTDTDTDTEIDTENDDKVMVAYTTASFGSETVASTLKSSSGGASSTTTTLDVPKETNGATIAEDTSTSDTAVKVEVE